MRTGKVMSAGISIGTRRVALRGVAIVAIAGFAAGCSSGVQRFTDTSVFTGATQNQRSIISKAAENQPYPGDVGVKPVVAGQDYTGSVNRAAVEPVRLTTGSVARSELPPVGQSIKTKAATIAAPAVAAVAAVKAKAASLRTPAAPAREVAAAATAKAAATYDTVTTGAVSRTAPAVGDAVKRGWSAAGGTQVTLREGETLYNLSRRYGVPVSAIVSANGLKDASAVAAGQKIIIPTYVYSSDVPVSAPDSNPNVAAAKSSRGIRDEAPANKAPAGAPEKTSAAVLPTATRPKQASAPAASAPKSGTTPTKSSPSTTVAGGYKVQPGDSLWSIAKRMKTTTTALKAANKLDGANLRVGQVLVIPTSSTTVASAKSPDVDPIITGTAKPTTASKTKVAATTSAASLPTYTAPKKAEAAIAEAEKSTAAAPEQTGIGKMRWPAKGRVVSGYGAKDSGKANEGIDISLPAGTPVKAAENGVVIYADGGLKEFGNTVLVRHEDGLVTVYAHNSDLKVKRGDKVTRGQQIASSGMSGDVKTPMLHFEVRKNSAPVDPSKYLD